MVTPDALPQGENQTKIGQLQTVIHWLHLMLRPQTRAARTLEGADPRSQTVSMWPWFELGITCNLHVSRCIPMYPGGWAVRELTKMAKARPQHCASA